ncbi:membrane protein [Candidatus Magnetobacterium bavaricum]|uniref:Membrane protein n=1 Tax=Candidatus Magnetobacterium bavaricum TaxID=29290 RepID=A0A0F3GXN6_9BACT|nr:membrane protein [Candidatus Magnetobacterium bavaricum]
MPLSKLNIFATIPDMMRYIKDLRTQVSVVTIVPLIMAVSIVLGMGYLLLSKAPQVQALVYAPALIVMASCLLYFWLIIFDNNRTKRQINEYLMLMNHPPPDVRKSEVPESQFQTELQANLARIITLLEQSNEPPVGGGNKELVNSVREAIEEGLKKHATTMHKSNNQHIEYIVSILKDIVSEDIKPAIDAIVSELTRTNTAITQADNQSQTSMQQLVNAINDLKSFKDYIITELARLPETLNIKPTQYSEDIKAIIGQLQLLPEQMRSTQTTLTTCLSAAINDIQCLYRDGFEHIGKLSTHSTIAYENLERLIPLIDSSIEKQADTLKESTHVVNLIRESAVLLAGASGDVRFFIEGLVKAADSQERLYINFNDLFKEIEGISKLNTRLLEKEQSTFKELEGTIEKTLTNLVIQTDVFTVHTTEWLNGFINDVTSGLSKTSDSMDKQTARLMEWTNSVDQHIGKLSTHSTIVHENLERLIPLIDSSIEKQADTLKESTHVVNLIRESAALLAVASGDVRLFIKGLVKAADSQERLYINFNDLFKEIEGISKLNTRLLEKEQSTFKELEGTIEKTLTNLVIQTDVFTVRTTEWLSRFINDVTSGLSKTSGSMDKQTARLMDWTNSVDQHISKLSTQSTITQDGFNKLVNLINSAIEKQARITENSSRAVNLIKESAVLLVSASTGVKGLTDGLINATDTQGKLYVSFNDMLREIEGKSTLNTQLLEQEKLTLKEIEATIERLLLNLVKQTDIFTGRTTDGLSRFINDINTGLSTSVNSLRGVIHVQTELVDEISSALVQLNDKLKG